MIVNSVEQPEASISITFRQVEIEFLFRLMYNHVSGVGYERGACDGILEKLDPIFDKHDFDKAPLFCSDRYDLIKLI